MEEEAQACVRKGRNEAGTIRRPFVVERLGKGSKRQKENEHNENVEMGESVEPPKKVRKPSVEKKETKRKGKVKKREEEESEEEEKEKEIIRNFSGLSHDMVKSTPAEDDSFLPLNRVTNLVWPKLQAEDLPFTYATISQQEYEKALARTESKDERVPSLFRRFAEWIDGEVQIVEIPSDVHESTAQVFVECIIEKELHKGVPVNQRLKSTGNISCNNLEPDASFRPRNKPMPGPGGVGACDNKGNAFPNLVVEVGVSVGLTALRAKAALWLGPTTTVQIVVIFYVHHYNRNGRRRMRAEVFTRANMPGNALQAVEFGTGGRTWNAAPPATPNALNQVFLRLPLNLLYHGTPGIPPQWGMKTHFRMDLYRIQQDIIAIGM